MAHFLFLDGEMRQVSIKVQEIIDPIVRAMAYELVGVEYVTQGGRPTLRIYIDKPGGVTVDDCQRVSEQVGALLDVEEPLRCPYYLEVSSPGVERPLFEPKHFAQFTGHVAKIRMKSPVGGRRKFVGIIQGVAGGEVIIREGEQNVVLPLANMEKAHLVPDI
jgi:ribosome maturation factor RimP